MPRFSCSLSLDFIYLFFYIFLLILITLLKCDVKINWIVQFKYSIRNKMCEMIKVQRKFFTKVYIYMYFKKFYSINDHWIRQYKNGFLMEESTWKDKIKIILQNYVFCMLILIIYLYA